ncbi:uncharacterized protein LOC126594313 [Malus sylvestris]|uniref:uncharacterized protein LOC126594313 n=1 Tax=Malus sylvestris TaxID=3752 RepID=UPI0021AC13BF|nr:uncharacterized protein LOC126594313 [Malus sylvestris]
MDEELVAYYLDRKINGRTIELEIIPEVDLYKCEPRDLPGSSRSNTDSAYINIMLYQQLDVMAQKQTPLRGMLLFMVMAQKQTSLRGLLFLLMFRKQMSSLRCMLFLLMV